MTRTYSTYVTVRVAVEADSLPEAKTKVKRRISEVRSCLPSSCKIYDTEINLALRRVGL